MTIRLHHRKYDLRQRSRPCRFHLPSITTNESSRLVGGFLGLQLPSTTTNESSRLVGWSLSLPQPSTTTNESSRLVGWSLSLPQPSTTTTESSRRSVSPMAPNFRSAHGHLSYSSISSGFPSPPILPRRESQPTNARIRSESPTILQTYPPPSDRHTSRIAALSPKESGNSDTASDERPPSVIMLASGLPES